MSHGITIRSKFVMALVLLLAVTAVWTAAGRTVAAGEGNPGVGGLELPVVEDSPAQREPVSEEDAQEQRETVSEEDAQEQLETGTAEEVALTEDMVSLQELPNADFNGDGRYSVADLALLVKGFGQSKADNPEDWATWARFDLNGDERIDIADVALAANRIMDEASL